MKFKFDENLDSLSAEPLLAAGHDVATVRSQKLSGRSDEVIHAVWVAEQRTLVTLDLDFSNPLRFPLEGSAGIIILRPARTTLSLIRRLLVELPPLLESRSPVGGLWILEFGRLRMFAPRDESE